MHSKCLNGDVFHSRRCDCGWQLHTAMEMIAPRRAWCIVYLDQEGRGIGCSTSSKRINSRTPVRIRSKPTSTWLCADLRNLWYWRAILLDLGLHSNPVLNQ